MITVKPSFVHWNYYMALEDDLKKIARYIEFNQDNFTVYSLELAHLLLATSSEVDVVLKSLCKLLDSNFNGSNINDYKSVIKEKLPHFMNEKICISRYGITDVQPWLNWTLEEEKSPNWWKAYNGVKHQRDTNFKEANLQHVINSIGALLITNFYYYKILLQQTENNPYSNKEIISKLSGSNTFVQLHKDYYYKVVVI